MAVGAIGGLILTVLVTLFFVPVFYISARRKRTKHEVPQNAQ